MWQWLSFRGEETATSTINYQKKRYMLQYSPTIGSGNNWLRYVGYNRKSTERPTEYVSIHTYAITQMDIGCFLKSGNGATAQTVALFLINKFNVKSM